MKKLIFLFIGIQLISAPLFACDLCSIYMNLEPNDLRNSAGFNYRYRTFNHTITEQSTNYSLDKHAIGNTVISNSFKQEERYNSYDLWFNYFLSEKWQVNGLMTFADNYYLEDDSVIINAAGPGDLSLTAKYMIYNTKVTDSSNWGKRILFGGGIKVPIGKFNNVNMVTPVQSVKGDVIYGTPYPELDPHIQTGTGSFDFILTADAQFRYKKIGTSTSIGYRINSENSNQFRFANRLNVTQNLFYIKKIRAINFVPNVGLYFEKGNRDQLKGEDYPNSGGESIFITSGLKIYYKDYGFGLNYQNPISQNLNDSQLDNINRVTGDLTFYF